MFNVLNEVNWLIILLATVVYFILGAVRFTPLFGKAYDIGTGVKRSSKQKWPTIYYYAQFLSSLVVSVAIGITLYAMNIQSLADAVTLGLLFGIALAAISLSNAVTPNMPRPVIFGLVVGSYHLVSAVIVAAIIDTLAIQ